MVSSAVPRRLLVPGGVGEVLRGLHRRGGALRPVVGRQEQQERECRHVATAAVCERRRVEGSTRRVAKSETVCEKQQNRRKCVDPLRLESRVQIRMCLSFKILNLFGMLSPRGSGNYRPSAPFLCKVAGHVKNCHFGDYYYYYNIGIKLSKYRPTTGRLIFNVIPGYRG